MSALAVQPCRRSTAGLAAVPPESRTNTSPRPGRFTTRPGGRAGGSGAPTALRRGGWAERADRTACRARRLAIAFTARVTATEAAAAAVSVLTVLAIVISPL